MEDQSSDSQMDEHQVIRSLIKMMGDDPTREGVAGTPDRVIKSYKELFSGYGKDPADILKTTFSTSNYNQMILCKDIELYSTCEHHLIPFYGKVDIGYIPGSDGRVVGLSKLARLAEIYSRRLQIQEQLTKQISDALVTYLNPLGTMVVIKAKHMCMCARGVGKQNSWMVTSAISGEFEKTEARSEFLALCNDK